MFYEQFEKLCYEKGTNPTAFVKDVLKLSTSKVTAWKNGSIPKIRILQDIANYFGVTVGYLFDGKEKSSVSELTSKEQELIEMYNLLTDYEKGELMGSLKTLTHGRTEEKNAETA